MPQHATPVYLAFIREVERWRIALSIPMWKLSDGAGLASRYYAKALYPETPSGRQANWETLQAFMEAIFPAGFTVRIEPSKVGCGVASEHRVQIKFSGARYDHEARKDWMTELSKRGAAKGGRGYATKVSKTQRHRNAKRAANTRWKRVRARRRAAINAPGETLAGN